MRHRVEISQTEMINRPIPILSLALACFGWRSHGYNVSILYNESMSYNTITRCKEIV